MAKERELKLLNIKKTNPELYDKVINGETSLHEAYNECKRLQLGLSEFRGRNTKKKEFAVDFKRIIQLHNPTLEELVNEIKKAYPYSWKEIVKG